MRVTLQAAAGPGLGAGWRGSRKGLFLSLQVDWEAGELGTGSWGTGTLAVK